MTIHQATHALVRWTGFAFAASMLAWGIWDLVLIYRGELGHGNSASSVIAEVVRANIHWALVIAFIVGILFGHFFFAMKVKA